MHAAALLAKLCRDSDRTCDSYSKVLSEVDLADSLHERKLICA